MPAARTPGRIEAADPGCLGRDRAKTGARPPSSRSVKLATGFMCARSDIRPRHASKKPPWQHMRVAFADLGTAGSGRAARSSCEVADDAPWSRARPKRLRTRMWAAQ
jgi:hypothetical protein